MFAQPNSGNLTGGKAVPVNTDLDRRLLVFHGDCAFLKLTREVGEAMGFKVEATSQVREFMRIYDSFAPSVIVYDFFSSNMDGFELVNWLNTRNSSARVVLTSQKESFFLGAAQEFASVKGHLNIDVMVGPMSHEDVSDLLASRLQVGPTKEIFEATNRRLCPQAG